MNRRHFLSHTSAALLGAAALARPAQALRPAMPSRRLDRIGLELYSVRDAMQRDPERTLAAVRSMGYVDVELLWSMGNFGRTPKQVKITLDAEGLRAPSAHIDPRLLTGDWDRALDDARFLGHEYLIVPSLPRESSATLDDWRVWGDRLNAAGEKARAAGLWVAFHNEPHHMQPIDGVVPYDVMLERTTPALVRHQLDVGNLTMGGGDPVLYLSKHHDRYWSFHIKDVVPDRSRDTGLGEGTVELRRILAMVRDIERKPCYVEQEGSADPMASAKLDFDYLKALEF